MLGIIERMKIRRLILIVSLPVAVAALASWLVISYWERSDVTYNILPKLGVAEQRYLSDHASRGQPLPTSVTLQDLVSGGYISTNEVRSLAGADVTFYPTATEATPQAILVRVRMPDGSQTVALADGSVQSVSR
jgi:hypothetical protein